MHNFDSSHFSHFMQYIVSQEIKRKEAATVFLWINAKAVKMDSTGFALSDVDEMNKCLYIDINYDCLNEQKGNIMNNADILFLR